MRQDLEEFERRRNVLENQFMDQSQYQSSNIQYNMISEGFLVRQHDQYIQ